jgi:uncharacterized protein YjdB
MRSLFIVRSKWIALVLSLGMFASGCGTSSAPSSSQSPASVAGPALQALSINPVTPILVKGQTLQLTATGVYSDNSQANLSANVVWSVANPSIATVSSAGALTSLSVGTTTITATFAQSISASAQLQVTDGTLASLKLTPGIVQIPMGVTQQIQAIETYQDQTSQIVSGLTWASSNPAIASVDANGNVTPVQAGIVSITATDPTTQISGSAAVSVTQATLNSIAVTFTQASVPVRLSSQAVAIGSFSDGSSVNLTSEVQWSSSDASVASFSQALGSQGLIEALVPGSVQITATLGTVSGYATFTVSSAVLTQIQVSPSNAQLALGVTQQYSATGIYSDGSSQDISANVKWSSSANAIALISSSGLASPVSPGATTILAEDPVTEISGSASLSILQAALQSMSITINPSSLAAGQTAQADVQGTYSDGTTLDLSSSVIWTSSNTNTATIASGGAITTWAQGSTVITAQDVNSGLTQNYTLDVAAPVGVSLQIGLAKQNISGESGGAGAGKARPPIVGNEQLYVISEVFSDGSSANVSSEAVLSFSNPNLVSLNSGTNYTLVATGEEVLTVTLPGTSLSATDTFTITNGTITSLNITQSDGSAVQGSYAAGATFNLIVTAVYQNGVSIDVTSQVAWSVSDASNISGELIEQNVGSSSAVEQFSVSSTALTESISITVTMPDGTTNSVSTSIGNTVGWDIGTNPIT